jgi:uncharacterized membrane protein YeaQ/YmgE (transglycosylase-associated protein family)
MWLILGLTIGYLGNLILSADPDRGCFMNVLVGTIGALWASRLLASHLYAMSSQSVLNAETGLLCLLSLLVAVVLVGLMNLLRSGRLR